MEQQMPRLLSIPEDANKLIKKLRSNRDHLGLLAAHQSMENGRSSSTATILLVGSTGVGKSSTINSLLNTKLLAKTSGSSSCSSKIANYDIDIPLPEYGVKNGKLRIIDTPGFGDTRNSNLDNQFVATLDKFFGDHTEYCNKVPSIVLIVGTCSENRFSGENSTFVKMLKGLELVGDKIFDPKKSNVIVFLTHLMSLLPKEQRKHPLPICEAVSNVVAQFTTIPKPIVVVAGENLGEDYDLEQENGYYILPNRQHYPHNLFLAMQNLIKDYDPMGEVIIRTAFKDIARYNTPTAKYTDLVPAADMYVIEIEKSMNRIQFQLEKNEINKLLDEAWSSIDKDVRKNYPGAITSLKRDFQRKRIQCLSDLPMDTAGVLILVKSLMVRNPTVQPLLSSLGLQIPQLNIPLLAGYCYDIMTDSAIPSTIFKLTNKCEISPIGYLVPENIECKLNSEMRDVFNVSRTNIDYVNTRRKDLNVTGDLGAKAFNAKAEAAYGYNILDSESGSLRSAKITALREYRVFQLTTRTDMELNAQFHEAVKSLPTFQKDDDSCREKYKSFFSLYGTHVVVSCFGGGAIEISSSDDGSERRTEIKDENEFAGRLRASILKMLDLGVDTDYHNQIKYGFSPTISNSAFSANFRGGDIKYHSPNLTELQGQDAKNRRQAWVESLQVQPIMLTTNMQLVPISNYAKKCNPDAESNIAMAAKYLYEANLEYTPPQVPPPPARSNVPAPGANGGSCLKEGTLILMADGIAKPIESIKCGDKVLDKNLQPCIVIGAAYFFLGSKKFYGFSTESASFFTGGHIFVGKESNQFYVASAMELFNDNPFIEGLRANCIDPTEKIELLMYDELTKTVSPRFTKLMLDPQSYDPKTPAYFIIVDSPSGTYIANNFVVRHSLPQFELYPMTLACLYKLFMTPQVKSISNEIMSIELYQKLTNIANLASDCW